jgi:hypothetical protein
MICVRVHLMRSPRVVEAQRDKLTRGN